MGSEKVKRIKLALEQKIHLVEYVDEQYADNVSIELLKDILTLINELESENEKLKQHKRELQGGQQDLTNRIAELEKEKKENTSYAKGYADGIKNTYEAMLPQKLENFTERLKEKFYYEARICRYIIDSDVFNETLKEFISDK